jgi:hypothetical protein
MLALLVAACETTSDRIREKSGAYASLNAMEKEQIANGVVAVGFTPDMVYMAIGNPAKVASVDSAEGKTELWTFTNYYPSGGPGHFQYGPINTDHTSRCLKKGQVEYLALR